MASGRTNSDGSQDTPGHFAAERAKPRSRKFTDSSQAQKSKLYTVFLQGLCVSYGLWEIENFRKPSQFDGTRNAMGSREGSEPAVASNEWRLPLQTPTTNKRGRPLRVAAGPSCSGPRFASI